jgi:hypothetical protein
MQRGVCELHVIRCRVERKEGQSSPPQDVKGPCNTCGQIFINPCRRGQKFKLMRAMWMNMLARPFVTISCNAKQWPELKFKLCCFLNLRAV